ncbi:hypothetical protein LTR36_008512 [Oleoguttula mirabilis]|uniref:Uncharacterized protein n=1 Tax=Oleoguttula mirabilis TaxID=1507867 RepID=A0AAV9JTA2_9PEZI|nr:hypothetical protein LTR36_008512 [Oleoguttula mirabilis]
MCQAYFYHYPTCTHTSILLHNLCENAVRRGRDPCEAPERSQPQCIVCDEPCPHCIGSVDVRQDDDREDLETVVEGGESEVSGQAQQSQANLHALPPLGQRQPPPFFGGQQEAQWRFPDADVAGQDVPQQYEAQPPGYAGAGVQSQPGGHSADAMRWPLQDNANEDEDDDGETATQLRSTGWNDHSNVTGHEYNGPEGLEPYCDEDAEVKRQRREAELEEAQLQAALQASMHEIGFEDSARAMAMSAAEAADYEQQILERVKQVSMRLPLEDEESMLHEVKKASIRTLEEQHLREYERRHAAMASLRRPTKATSQASSSTTAYSTRQPGMQPQGAVHMEPATTPMSPRTAAREYWTRQDPVQTGGFVQQRAGSVRPHGPPQEPDTGRSAQSIRPPSPTPSEPVTIRSSQRQRAEEEYRRQRLYSTRPTAHDPHGGSAMAEGNQKPIFPGLPTLSISGSRQTYQHEAEASDESESEDDEHD